MRKKYFTEEERKEAKHQYYLKNREKILEHVHQYVNNNKEIINERCKHYRESNKEKCREAVKRWYEEHPMEARANGQISSYRTMDIRNGFGDVIDFDANWMVKNIYTKPCPHCGRSGWENMGCNRIDNKKPHTKDNVEPCCGKCNNDLAAEYNKKRYSKKLIQIIIKDGSVKEWDSVKNASKTLGYNQSAIADACRGEYSTHKAHEYKESLWYYK